MDERNRYLLDHPNDTDFAALDERAFASAIRFGELRDELLEWSNAPANGFIDLLAAVLEQPGRWEKLARLLPAELTSDAYGVTWKREGAQ